MQMLSVNTIICCHRTHSWCLTQTQTSACEQGLSHYSTWSTSDTEAVSTSFHRSNSSSCNRCCCSITWFHSSGEWCWWRGDAGLKVTRTPLSKRTAMPEYQQLRQNIFYQNNLSLEKYGCQKCLSHIKGYFILQRTRKWILPVPSGNPVRSPWTCMERRCFYFRSNINDP